MEFSQVNMSFCARPGANTEPGPRASGPCGPPVIAVYLPPFVIRPRKPVLLHVLCGENSGPPVLIQYFRASAQDFCPLCGLPPPPETHLLPRQSFWLSPHSIPRVSQRIPDRHVRTSVSTQTPPKKIFLPGLWPNHVQASHFLCRPL